MLDHVSYMKQVLFSFQKLLNFFVANMEKRSELNLINNNLLIVPLILFLVFVSRSSKPNGSHQILRLVVYPLQLIATIRSIGGTGLRLDEFPELSMLELYLTLKARGETQRGSSVIMDRKCPKSKAIHVAPAVQIEAPAVQIEPVIEPVVEAPVVIEIPPVVESQIPEAQPVEQEQKQ